MSSRIVAMVASLSCVLAPVAGWAATADELIRDGLALRRRGDDAAALGLFEQAVAQEKSGRAMAQVALAEQALGRWVDAEAHLTEALAWKDEPWVTRNRPLLQNALADIASHLGTLEIACNVEGATITVNGVARGVLTDKPLRVVAGTVALEVTAEGFFPLVRNVTVLPGGTARESVALVATRRDELPMPAAATPAMQLVGQDEGPAPAGGNALKITGYVALGASAVFAAVGVVTLLSRNADAQKAIDQGCGTNWTGVCDDLRADVDSAETRMTITLSAAGALAVTGGILLWLAPAPAAAGDTGVAMGLRTRF